ncbi:unnamed protein product [Hymenolepis diminuta]|uniref:Uncharacterized protein n=1 Tax=Hymenolepis diminuta TaxID=6216 RepID=A0A564YW85_HYMDI|nr:unnamed protein product [Hymenolepis diminuta]
MSKRVHPFPLFPITASLHMKGASALKLWHGLTQVTHIKLPLFSKRGQRTLLSLFLSLSLLLIVASLNTFGSTQLLFFCFTIVVRTYPKSY